MAVSSTHTDVFFNKDLPKISVRKQAKFYAVCFDSGNNLTYLYFEIGIAEETSELFADIAAEFVKLHEQMPELEGHHEAIHDNL